MRDTFAVKRMTAANLALLHMLEPTRLTASMAPHQKPLNSDACIAMSMATVKKISGRWQIVKEFTMYSIDEIRDTCTAEDAPGAAAEEVAK
ncbi:MAG: hypothetical protein ACLTYN_04805 [Dysosmobacter welbionis]